MVIERRPSGGETPKVPDGGTDFGLISSLTCSLYIHIHM